MYQKHGSLMGSMQPPKNGTKLHLAPSTSHPSPNHLKVSGLSKIKALHWHIFSLEGEKNWPHPVEVKKPCELQPCDGWIFILLLGLRIFFGCWVLRFRFLFFCSIFNLYIFLWLFVDSFCFFGSKAVVQQRDPLSACTKSWHDPSANPTNPPNRCRPGYVMFGSCINLQHVFFWPHFVRGRYQGPEKTQKKGNYLRIIIHPNNVVSEK